MFDTHKVPPGVRSRAREPEIFRYGIFVCDNAIEIRTVNDIGFALKVTVDKTFFLSKHLFSLNRIRPIEASPG